MKIVFPRRKLRSESKYEEKSVESATAKSCCIATPARVRRGKAKGAEAWEETIEEESSPAKKKKSSCDASCRVSRPNSDVKDIAMTLLRSRRFTNFDSVHGENGCINKAATQKSKYRLQSKVDRETLRCSPKSISMKVPSVRIELIENVREDINLDNVFVDGSPSKCTTRSEYTGKALSSNKNSPSLTSHCGQRRYSSESVPDKPELEKIVQNGEKATCSEKNLSMTGQHRKRRYSSGSEPAIPQLNQKVDNERTLCSPTKSPFSTPVRIKQCPSCPGSENITPNRQLFCLGKQDGQLYKKAKHALHSSIPGSLLCRESEIRQIGTFLRSHLVHKQPGSLYISGAPGTGKTACLTQILEQLQRNGMDYQVRLINCMNLSQSRRIFSKITEELTGWDKLTNTEAQKFLEKKFTSKGAPIVVVLDEIDQLESKNQDILYTMFEWPSLPSSRLILIGIANALDLTDRVLPRMHLRPECKPQLLHFSPYTKDQIVKVLTARLSEVEGSGIVDVSAIQFCARKIAAISGDMRKALDICRRAVEIVEAEVKRQQILKPIGITSSPKKAVPKKVTISHVSKVISEVYGSRIVNSCGGEHPTIPLQQKLLICTVLLMQKESKLREIPVGQLHETYCKICKKRQVSQISQEDCLALCNLLETRGIISMKRAKETRMTKVSLKIDEKEVDHALQDKILLSSILQEGLAK